MEHLIQPEEDEAPFEQRGLSKAVAAAILGGAVLLAVVFHPMIAAAFVAGAIVAVLTTP